MAEYKPTGWRDAFRVYSKALRIVVEPAFVAGAMLLLGVPLWGYVLLLILWLPLGRIRVRELRNEWGG
jgi:hypothetical protein